MKTNKPNIQIGYFPLTFGKNVFIVAIASLEFQTQILLQHGQLATVVERFCIENTIKSMELQNYRKS